MKRILILLFAIMFVFCVTGSAMAAAEKGEPGWYYKGKNPTEANLWQYFPNGHPTGNSEWQYYGPNPPPNPPPPVNDCCNDAYANAALGGGWTAPTAVDRTMGASFDIEAYSYVYGGGEVTADASLIGSSDGEKYAQRILNSDGTATIGAVVGSASWADVKGEANGYIGGVCGEGCVENKCDDAIEVGITGSISQFTENALNVGNSSGLGAGNWAIGGQMSKVTFTASSETDTAKTLGITAEGKAIGGTIAGVYSTGNTSIAGAVTGGMSYGSHTGTTGTVNASGEGYVAHGTYASMRGAEAVTFGTANYCYDVTGTNYASGGGYAYTYGISTVAQYGQNGVMATTYTKSGACSGGNCGSVPSFNQ